MAINTRNKRASLINLALPFARLLPAPDSTLDARDRRMLLFLYCGNLTPATPRTGTISGPGGAGAISGPARGGAVGGPGGAGTIN